MNSSGSWIGNCCARFRLRHFLFVLAAASLAACGKADGGQGEAEAGPTGTGVGLVTSLPILWSEQPDIASHLDDGGGAHWALAAFRERGDVKGIDTLAGKDGTLALPRVVPLVMAQPYPLSADENVALDDWVRGGGRVLLFADPMLTQHSVFALGDRRRPQDIVMLSPILTHWGLALQFDEAQPAGDRRVRVFGGQIPVNLPGSFALLPGSRSCALDAGGLVAECVIGAGKVLAVADAALLEPVTDEAEGESRRAMLVRLLARLSD